MKTYINIIAALSLYVSMAAQGLQDNKLKVEKEYKTDLYTSRPIKTNYKIKSTPVVTATVTADSLMAMGGHQPDLSLSIAPTAYTAQSEKSPHIAHINLHKGTINPWNVDAAIIHKVDNYYTIGANGYYDKWNEKNTNDKFTRERGGALSAKYYINDRHYANARVEANSLRLGQYGKHVDNSTATAHDTIDISAKKVSIGIANFDQNQTAWTYAANMSLTQTKHRLEQKSKENWWYIDGLVTKSFAKHWDIQTEVEANFIRYNGSTNLFANATNVRYNGDRITAEIGATYNTHISNSKSIYPMARIHWNATPNTIIRAEVREHYVANALSNTLAQNPYLNINEISKLPTAKLRDHQLSVTTEPMKALTLSATAKYQQHTNAQNWSLAKDRSISIGTTDYSQIAIDMDMKYQINNFLSAELNGGYNHYDSEETLYHRPVWHVRPSLNLNLWDDKLTASLSGHVNGKQLLSSEGNTQVNSGIRKDISASIAYRPLRNVSVYLNADNLLNDDYQLFGNYKVFGRNLSAGVLIKL